MKKIIGSLSAIALLGALALPVGNVSAKSGYGMAGCGLGSMVIGPKPGMIQIVALTTNGVFGSQFFGITTGTSNCTSNGVIKAELDQRAFVAYNYDALKMEIAVGNGETLNSLAYLMGCPAESTQDFASMTQANFSKIFEGEKGQEADWVLHRIKQSVTQSKELKNSCSKIWL